MRSARPFVAAGLLLLALACSNDPEPPPPDTDPSPSIDDPADTDPPPGQDADDDHAHPEQLAATWESFHTAWVEQAALDDPDPAAFDGLAADPGATVEQLDALRAGGRLVTTDQELWPRFDIDDDRAEIVDCAIVSQHPADQPDSVATITISWEATAITTDDGWRVDTAQPGELFCVAEELNDQLLAAYEHFRAAKNVAWDPPDPDHPDLEATMVGEQLTFIRDLLAEHQREGIVIRDPAPTDNAVVFEVGIGEASVSDCTVQVLERGAFDLATGERRDDLIPPIREGQLDGQSVDLERTMVGRQLEFIRELLTEHQRDGIVIRDPAPTDNAVVFDVGIGTATVSDCTEQVAERGAFDLETGERLDDLIPPIPDGQLDGQSVELERQSDGSWRVAEQAGTRDTDCVPGSTNYAVS